MTQPVENQIWMRDSDTATIRVDRVADGKVYYVAWRDRQVCGNPIRKPVDDFLKLCADEGMRVDDLRNRQNNMKPWHDTPNHVVDGEICAPIVYSGQGFYMCAGCGDRVGGLSDADKARAQKACEAWEGECERQHEAAKAKAEYDRKVPLLADAIARRKANTKVEAPQ